MNVIRYSFILTLIKPLKQKIELHKLHQGDVMVLNQHDL